MTEIIIENDHKWAFEKVSDDTYRATFYELTAGRWIQLGPSELWSAELALELITEGA